MSILVVPRVLEKGNPKDAFFGFITVDDRPDVWESRLPIVGPAPRYCIQSLCPDGSARDANCQCQPTAGIIVPVLPPLTGDPAVSPTEPGMPPVQEQPPWWQLPGLFPAPSPTALPIGAAGTTVVSGARGNPLATLLLLAGIAAVGYYLYKRYKG